LRFLDHFGVMVFELIARLDGDDKRRVQEECANHGADDDIRPSGVQSPNGERRQQHRHVRDDVISGTEPHGAHVDVFDAMAPKRL
jgi:hypothetical protein